MILLLCLERAGSESGVAVVGIDGYDDRVRERAARACDG